MPITYVTPDPPFNGQDAPLTALQHDTNIKTLADGIAALETALDGVISVENITSSGNIVTFHLSDDTTIDIAFDLPSFNYRAAWTNSTAYVVGDIVTVSGSGVYLVLIPHTTPASPEEFDPELTEGTDEDPVYGLLLPEPDLVRIMKWRGTFPAEQTISQYDVFISPIYGTFIANSTHVSAAEFDPDAVDDDENPLYTKIAPPAFAPSETVTVPTDGTYTVTRADVGKYLIFDADCIVVFSDEEFDDYTEVHFERATGCDSLTFEETTDITILPQRDGYDTAAPFVGAVITAKFRGEGTWKLIGPHGDELTA